MAKRKPAKKTRAKRKPKKEPLEWMRGRRADTEMAERMVWKSRCLKYRIEECNIRYGRTYTRTGIYQGYPTNYKAMVNKDSGWSIVSEHRTKAAAIKQCENFHQKGEPIKKYRRKRKLT